MAAVVAILVLVFLSSRTVQTQSTIESAQSKILFSKVGQLIPDVSFATISTKIDLTSIMNENKEMCDAVLNLQNQLSIKLNPCTSKDGKKKNPCPDDKTKSPETIKEFLKVPWKN